MDEPVSSRIKSTLTLIEGRLCASEKFQVFSILDEPRESIYSPFRIVGHGSFGIVCASRNLQTREDVAIKIVYQDKRFKNRELQIMKLVSHPNIVSLKEYFYCKDNLGNVYLNLVLEYLPDTVSNALQHCFQHEKSMDRFQVKLYMYQLLRGLAYLHSKQICHRDVKPHNLLLDPSTGLVKLCDFGSSKILVPGESNVSYICSRYYRAPELLMGAQHYTTSVDIWSAGCVMGELLGGSPLFSGTNEVDQLIQIFRIVGRPTPKQAFSINPRFRLPETCLIRPRGLDKVFTNPLDPDTADLLSRLLDHDPAKRLLAHQALFHPYFEELRHLDTCRTVGQPPLFEFTDQEITAHPELSRLNRRTCPSVPSATSKTTLSDLPDAAAKTIPSDPPNSRSQTNSLY